MRNRKYGMSDGIRRILRWSVAGILAAAVFMPCAFAATYYVDGSAATDGGTGSSASPKKYIKSGIALMAGGDTLIIRNGIYTGASNMIANGNNPWSGVPDGTAGAYTTIKAENYLGAVIDGESVNVPVYLSAPGYVRLENLHFRNSSGSNCIIYGGHHVKVMKCAAEESHGYGFRFYRTTYCLAEDCCAWGLGSYSIGFDGGYTASQYNVVRRFVSRRDAHWYVSGGNHWASFVPYTVSNVHFQNCISIDGKYVYAGNVSSPPGFTKSIFFTANGSQGVSANGCIGINNEGQCGQFESGASDISVRDCSFVMAPTTTATPHNNGFYTYGSNVRIDNNLVMNFASPSGAAFNGSAVYEVQGTLQECKNNIFNTGYYGFSRVAGSHNNNVLWNLRTNYIECSAGANEVTDRDPRQNGLLYPVRIEAGSFLSAAGEGSTQCGPEILKRIGVSGTLYGEAGWNTVTNEDLWPFPNEDAMRAKMRAYNLHGMNGARGFCADGTTLTRYIWEYLGTPIPAEIYGGTSNNPPIAAASATPLSGTAPLTVAFTGSGTDTDGTAASYSWNFGDNTTSAQQSPSHVYMATGTYNAVLTVTDNGGARGTASVTITVTSAAATTYSISGTVRNSAGTALANVTVNLTGGVARAVTTGTAGTYSFTGLSGSAAYTVTPQLSGYTFAPVYISTNSLSGNLTGRDFTGTAAVVTAPTYYMSGTVKDSSTGGGLSGVTLAITGSATGSTTTASSGYYRFDGLPEEGSFVITPYKSGYTFNPSSDTKLYIGSNQENRDFTGTPVPAATYSISGTVRNNAGVALANATVLLTGGASRSATTGTAGTYSFTGLPGSAAYTVTPQLSGYTFAPVLVSTNSLGGNLAGRDFTGTPIPPATYSISGYVRNASGAGVTGVTVTLSGGASRIATTASTGYFEFSALTSGTGYTVTPSVTNGSFSPVSISTNSLGGNLTGRNFTVSFSYAISGTVRNSAGTALANVTVNLTGGATRTATTGAAGTYSFTGLPASAAYTVTPQLSGYTFAPVSISTNSLGGNLTGRDFNGTAAVATYYMSGTVKDSSTGGGLSGVTLAITGSATGSMTTASSGYYRFDGLPADGSFVITPYKSGYTFNPSSDTKLYIGSNQENRDFTGTPVPAATYSISGYVRNASGTGAGGVTVALTGGASRTATTGSTGYYEFTSLAGNTGYTVTPSVANGSFSPVSISTNSLGGNLANRNFTITVTFSVSGTVRNNTGNGIGNVKLNLTGAATRSTTTAGDGTYTFTGLPGFAAYTITPELSGYTFDPVSASTTSLVTNRTGRDFTGTPVPSSTLYSISGYVKDIYGYAMTGVTVKLSGSRSAVYTTSGSGFYQFTGLPGNGVYTIAPTMNKWKFTPSSMSYSSLSGDLMNRNFAGRRSFFIKGKVIDTDGAPVAGANVELSGAENQTTITDTAGVFQFDDVSEQTDYTVTTFKSGFMFIPQSRPVRVKDVPVQGVNFLADVSQALGVGQMKIIGSAQERGGINPDKGDVARIYFKGIAAGRFDLKIFSSAGDIVWEDYTDNVQEGTFIWTARDVAAGLYTARIKGPGMNSFKRIAVLR